MAKKRKAKEQKQITNSSRTRDATTKGSTASFEGTGLKSKTKKSVHNGMGEQVRSCVVVSSRERDEAGRF